LIDGTKQGTYLVDLAYTYSQRQRNSASIFTAELHAKFQCLETILVHSHPSYRIASESLPSFEVIAELVCTQHFVQRIHFHYSLILRFTWICSHIRIAGNENADKAAKLDALLPSISPRLPTSTSPSSSTGISFGSGQITGINGDPPIN